MHEKNLKSGLAQSGAQETLVIITIAFNRDCDGKNQEKLAEFTYFLPTPPSHKLPSISLERGEKTMSSFLQPISVVYFTDCIMDGQSGAQNIMVHPGCQMWIFPQSALLEPHPQPLQRLGSWGVGWNIHLVTPGWSKKESNPDNLRGVQILVSSQPHVLRRVSIILHLLVLRFCLCHSEPQHWERRQESLSQTG